MNQADNDFYNSINELLGYSLPGSVTDLCIKMNVETGVSITVTFLPFRDSPNDSTESITKTFGLAEIT